MCSRHNERCGSSKTHSIHRDLDNLDEVDRVINHPTLQALSPFQTPMGTPRLYRATPSKEIPQDGVIRREKKKSSFLRLSRCSSLIGSKILLHFNKDKSNAPVSEKIKYQRERNSMPELDIDRDEPTTSCAQEAKLQKEFHNLNVIESFKQTVEQTSTKVVIHEDHSSIPSTPKPKRTLPIDDVLHTPSPPSTAPLPVKFRPGSKMNGVRSISHIPVSNSPFQQVSSITLQIPQDTSIRQKGCEETSQISDIKTVSSTSNKQHAENKVIAEIKSRPSHPQTQRLQLGARPKFSSIESVNTSSSSNISSLESIRSSSSSECSSRSVRNSSESSRCSSRSSGLNSIKCDNDPNANTLLDNSLTSDAQYQSSGSKVPNMSLSLCRNSELNHRTKKPSPIMEDVGREQEDMDLSNLVDVPWDMPKLRKKLVNNHLYARLSLMENGNTQGSDSGISIESHSRDSGTSLESSAVPCPRTDAVDLPFDMPKLRRRHPFRTVSFPSASNDEQPELDQYSDLPFDMPKLRRIQQGHCYFGSPQFMTGKKLNFNQQNIDSRTQGSCRSERPSLTLNFSAISPKKQRQSLQLNLNNFSIPTAEKDESLPLERQGWYHGAISGVDAENILRYKKEGSFLIRNAQSSKLAYSLSLKSARGFIHMRVLRDARDQFLLGESSNTAFLCIPDMVQHYSVNKLPIHGAEHMSLLYPVIDYLL